MRRREGRRGHSAEKPTVWEETDLRPRAPWIRVLWQGALLGELSMARAQTMA